MQPLVPSVRRSDYQKGRGEGIHALGKHSLLREVLSFSPGDVSADARFAPAHIFG